MDNSKMDVELLDQALEAFENETGLELKLVSMEARPSVDATLVLEPRGPKYSAELKRWAPQANLGAMIAQLNKLPTPALLVADYINPNMADRLRDAGFQFIDASGNAYLKTQTLHIYVKGNKPSPVSSTSRKTSRVFGASGLKLVFSFLLNPDLVNHPYRTIADLACVSLGSVGKMLSALREQGYLVEQGKGKKRTLRRTRELLDRWVSTFPETLSPQLEIGVFESNEQAPWKSIKLSALEGCWGGEVGASILDAYLSPSMSLIYLPKDRLRDFVIQHRLKKASDQTRAAAGRIQVREKFWTDKLIGGSTGSGDVAPDILIYADLIASGDPRNLEAAERLYGRIEDRLQFD
ncbi:hypothetical protein EB809_17360 [Marinobacter sp. R17]|uniref:type IV toxin-antitoxin system AbiEi family antitoxin n=1 Tax=Marinobacter sp. R17 TaxID=2484250 RepID=UPI000F4CF7BC|nr:type IV toxin-antitoxin system AbiEi family antitoxin [Marinobacter sp. R17]ROT96203.1 hypothetical protein EB809_17360 [Marinobacter sp. R17]